MNFTNSGHNPFRTVTSRVVWSCPWYSIRQDEIILPDGRQGVYNVVQHPGAAWVIPVTSTGFIALLYHYRYTVDDWCWEIPAGGIKAGQTLEETALAELKEEVGGTASAIEYAGSFYTANGICNEEAHIFIATGVSLGTPDHEPTEIMDVHQKPISEVIRMAHINEISDGPTALALLLSESRLLALARELDGPQ
jgi:ADP-ribose pyrophosphatase